MRRSMQGGMGQLMNGVIGLTDIEKPFVNKMLPFLNPFRLDPEAELI